jgi:uncharacterized membrane protein
MVSAAPVKSGTARPAPVKPEHRWPPVVAATCAVLLYAFLPNSFSLIPSWVMPTVALLLVIPLIVFNPHRLTRDAWWSRALGILLACVILAANQIAMVEAIMRLLDARADGRSVLVAMLQVWATDVIAFGLIYWELDRGGSVARRMRHDPDKIQDFRFPQEDNGPTPWKPAFTDYLFFSLSTMMAFSPTDVMPLSTRAKGLMALQSLTGFVVLALVISRAVNILA